MSAFRWTPQEDMILRRGLKARKSYSQIGAILGATRNSVAGRVFRLREKGALL